MGLISPLLLRLPVVSVPPPFSTYKSALSKQDLSFQLWAKSFLINPTKSCSLHAKKGDSQQPDPVIQPTLVEEVVSPDNEDEDDYLDDFDEDETLMDGEDEDEEDDDADLYAGDGGAGGGIALAGTWWDKEALRIAEDVCLFLDGELKLYAFNTLSNSTIRVRIERLTNKSGSPSMEDIEAFSATYRVRLDEAELAKTIPEDISFEVSSPGVERVVRIPEELERFKDRAMYVKYVSNATEMETTSESDGVFRLISFDMEARCCIWGLADVRINREKAGKGRPLSKKQREWRLNTPFDGLRLIRLYSEF